MKFKFSSEDDLPLNKQLKFPSIKSLLEVFLKKMVNIIHNFFLNRCLYQVQMLEYERIDISEGIDLNKSNKSKECDICHYRYFLDENFNYEPYLCNGCHDLMQKAMNFHDVAIVSIKESDNRIHFWYMSKSDAINLLNNSVLDNKGVL